MVFFTGVPWGLIALSNLPQRFYPEGMFAQTKVTIKILLTITMVTKFVKRNYNSKFFSFHL